MEYTDDLIALWNLQVPRYTSYPTARVWKPLEHQTYEHALRHTASSSFSCYLHIPFCQKVCHYCGCATTACTNNDRKASYVKTLKQEIVNTASLFERPLTISSLHIGGGTPSSLSLSQLSDLIKTLSIAFTSPSEIAIEIDPRFVYEDANCTMAALHQMGVTRASLGVQDFDTSVQKAIGRFQQKESVVKVLEAARTHGVDSVNFDIVYGLPGQTTSSFDQTLQEVVRLRPDRVALFPFAYLPETYQHQRAIDPDQLPSVRNKFFMSLYAKKVLLSKGYVSIGMDHFALPFDSLALAVNTKKLKRNFQGYTTDQEVLGFGYSAISTLSKGFFQRPKDFASYEESVAQGHAPTSRGILFCNEDILRGHIIQQLLCYGHIEKKTFFPTVSQQFDVHFAEELLKLRSLVALGLVEENDHSISIPPYGHPFVRLIASCFDAYHHSLFTVQGGYER